MIQQPETIPQEKPMKILMIDRDMCGSFSRYVCRGEDKGCCKGITEMMECQECIGPFPPHLSNDEVLEMARVKINAGDA